MNNTDKEELISNIPSYLRNAAKDIIQDMENTGITDIQRPRFYIAIKALDDLVKDSFISDIISTSKHIEALDAFDQKFIIGPYDYEILKDYYDVIYNLRLIHPTNSIETILLNSSTRFSVVYDGLDGRFRPNQPSIINIPANIYKFIVENNFGNDVIKAFLDENMPVNYNFVEYFNFIIKHGSNFKEKSELLGNKQSNILEFASDKCNKIHFQNLIWECKAKLGEEYYTELSSQCQNYDIHFFTFLYRLNNLSMPYDEAIQLGISERDKYKITYKHRNVSDGLLSGFNVVDSFYEYINEYIKENNI